MQNIQHVKALTLREGGHYTIETETDFYRSSAFEAESKSTELNEVADALKSGHLINPRQVLAPVVETGTMMPFLFKPDTEFRAL